MKKVLFDTNTIIDVLLARNEFARSSSDALRLAERKLIKGYVSAASMTDIYYIVQKTLKDSDATMKGLDAILGILKVAKVDQKCICNAVASDWKDFEDAVQNECARSNGINIIVTRNPKDFVLSRIEICSPEDLLKKFTETL